MKEEKTHLRTETGIAGQLKFEKSYWRTTYTGEELYYYVITENKNFSVGTDGSLELFNKVQEHRLFGEFDHAYMTDPSNVDAGHLVLVDVNENELHLSGCTAGYTGTGPHGTLEILKKAGFEIDLMNLVFRNKSFKLKHPKHNMYIDKEPSKQL